MRFYAFLLAIASAHTAFLLAGCDPGNGEVHFDAGVDAGHDDAGHEAAPHDECHGACLDTQVCGIGCGSTPGCYTPGGSLDNPTPNDCPACFPISQYDSSCKGAVYCFPHSGNPPYCVPAMHAMICQPEAPGDCVSSDLSDVSCCY